MNSRVATAGLLLVGLMLSACGTGDTPLQPVGSSDLAAAVAERLEPEIGYLPDVTCTESLPAVVGASVTCDVDSPAGIIPATVTVSEVDKEEGTVTFDVLVDTATP